MAFITSSVGASSRHALRRFVAAVASAIERHVDTPLRRRMLLPRAGVPNAARHADCHHRAIIRLQPQLDYRAAARLFDDKSSQEAIATRFAIRYFHWHCFFSPPMFTMARLRPPVHAMPEATRDTRRSSHQATVTIERRNANVSLRYAARGRR